MRQRRRRESGRHSVAPLSRRLRPGTVAMKYWDAIGNGNAAVLVAIALAAAVFLETEALRQARLGHVLIVILGFETCLALLCAWFLLHETYALHEILGLALIILGVAVAHPDAGRRCGLAPRGRHRSACLLLSARSRRQVPGAAPTYFLKARLKAASERYPTSAAAWATLLVLSSRRRAAICKRHRARYCIGGTWT